MNKGYIYRRLGVINASQVPVKIRANDVQFGEFDQKDPIGLVQVQIEGTTRRGVFFLGTRWNYAQIEQTIMRWIEDACS